MPVNLLQIQDFLQPYINAISIILNVGVTVVDKDLTRICGTSVYADQVGQTINHTSFYKDIIKTGRPNIMIKSLDEQTCAQCNSYDQCIELADIAYPIYYENEVIGVIGVIAFSEKEKEKIIENNSNYQIFLQHMSVLLESKLLTLKQTYKLEEKLDGVMSLAKHQLDYSTHFVGNNPKVRGIIELATRISHSDSTVLILGESGTGKEVLAKTIHDSSNRADKMMVSINCAAIPENLIESELFGYEAGAFTGANKKGQIGKFELANNSTLFLDEIGEMSLATQTKLLRVLQDKEIFRLGSNKPTPVNVRLICATNQDLSKRVDEGKFRLDLFYRINVIPFELSPLRERPDDIELLCQTFLKQFNEKLKKHIKLGKSEVINMLKNYSWPGNVRELRNIIEYLVNVCERGHIELEDLPAHFIPYRLEQSPENHSFKVLMAEQERRLLKNLLETATTLEAKKKLAQKLDISLSSLYRKMAQHNLQQ